MSVETRTIKPVRSLFTNVIKMRQFTDPRTKKPVGDPKHDALFLLDKADFDALFEQAKAAAAEEWPGRDPQELSFACFKPSEKVAEKRAAKLRKEGKSDEEIAKDVAIYPPGHFTLKATSKFPVLLCYSNGERIVTVTEEERAQFENKFYNGCIVSAVVEFFTYPAKKDEDKDGVTCYLKQLFWVGPGERIGGQGDTSAFNEYIGQAVSEDPTGEAAETSDDGLPF